MIFVDIGAWFAATIPRSVHHVEAQSWMQERTSPLITTDYIIDETLTLMRARREPEQALQFGRRIFSGEICTIEYVTTDDIQAAWRLFEQYADKQWSFTDCTTKVVMERLDIKTAFAFDQHFRQFGSVDVVP